MKNNYISRRDDIESLGYILLYLFNKNYGWFQDDININNKFEKYFKLKYNLKYNIDEE